jgi:haloalkane dehalogenase
MYMFVECWKARPEWLALGREARENYMSGLGMGVEALLKAGVEIVSWSMNDTSITNRGPFDYFAVWKFPDREAAGRFEQMIHESGWYRYFDQVNLGGPEAGPALSISHMISL